MAGSLVANTLINVVKSRNVEAVRRDPTASLK